MPFDDETIEKAGVIGASQIQSIENGMPFWTDLYKSTVINAIERNFKTDVLRTHGISDVVNAPEKENLSERFLVESSVFSAEFEKAKQMEKELSGVS